ncbi:chromate transport protein ChrA [Deinococcus budaensis]|uniref:Chromate transport protein ChrA n=1 Tax=Deinococcus budaensis TaxID=1665626 RepID=A0A7W8GBS6_9DEIO|nr:chromate transport protein ChrA [Deinococcus budaensis]
MIVVALCLLVPGATELLTRTGYRSRSLLGAAALVAGFVWAVVSAWLILKWRQQRRRRRTGRERADDWICAACLHAEAAT